MTVVHLNSPNQRIVPFKKFWNNESDYDFMVKAVEYLKSKGWTLREGLTRREGRKLPQGQVIKLDKTNLVMVLGFVNKFGRVIDLAYRSKNEVGSDYENDVRPEPKSVEELDLDDDKYHVKSEEERDDEFFASLKKELRRKEKKDQNEFFDSL